MRCVCAVPVARTAYPVPCHDLEPKVFGDHLPVERRGVIHEAHVVVPATARRRGWQRHVRRPNERGIPRERLYVGGQKPNYDFLAVERSTRRGVHCQSTRHLRVRLSHDIRSVCIRSDGRSVSHRDDSSLNSFVGEGLSTSQGGKRPRGRQGDCRVTSGGEALGVCASMGNATGHCEGAGAVVDPCAAICGFNDRAVPYARRNRSDRRKA